VISETILSLCKANWRVPLAVISGLVVVGFASYFEGNGWREATTIPFALLTFGALWVTIMDLILSVFKRRIPGRIWWLSAATSVVLIGVMYYAFSKDPLPLLILAVLMSVVLLLVGFLKSRFLR